MKWTGSKPYFCRGRVFCKSSIGRYHSMTSKWIVLRVFFSIWMFYALIINCFKYITLLQMNLHLNWHTCLLYIAKLRFESGACFAAIHVITNKQNYREKKYKAFWLCFLHYIQCLAMCSVAFSRIQQYFSKCSMLWIGLLSWDWPQCTWQYTSITYK